MPTGLDPVPRKDCLRVLKAALLNALVEVLPLSDWVVVLDEPRGFSVPGVVAPLPFMKEAFIAWRLS